MKFEFDLSKNKRNQEKHGIDFIEIQRLWKGPSIEFAATHEFENRFARIGIIAGKLYTCIYTLREHRVRIISCRRSREKERKLYEKNIKEAKNT